MSESIYEYNKIGSFLNKQMDIIDNNYIYFLFLLYLGYWFGRTAHLYMPFVSNKKNDKIKSRSVRTYLYDHIYLFILSLALYLVGDFKNVFSSLDRFIMNFPIFLGTIILLGFLGGNSSTNSFITKHFGNFGYIQKKNLLHKSSVYGIPYGISISSIILLAFILNLGISSSIFKSTSLIKNQYKYILSIILILFISIFPIFYTEKNFSGTQYWFIAFAFLFLFRSKNRFNIAIISFLLGVFIYGFSRFAAEFLFINKSDMQSHMPSK